MWSRHWTLVRFLFVCACSCVCHIFTFHNNCNALLFCINLAMVDDGIFDICGMRVQCSAFMSVDSRTTLFLPLLCYTNIHQPSSNSARLCAVCIFQSSICNALNMRFDCCVMFYVSTFDYVLLCHIWNQTHFKLSYNNKVDVNWFHSLPSFRPFLNNCAMQFSCSFVRFCICRFGVFNPFLPRGWSLIHILVPLWTWLTFVFHFHSFLCLFLFFFICFIPFLTAYTDARNNTERFKHKTLWPVGIIHMQMTFTLHPL